jgi:hypothetical protein
LRLPPNQHPGLVRLETQGHTVFVNVRDNEVVARLENGFLIGALTAIAKEDGATATLHFVISCERPPEYMPPKTPRATSIDCNLLQRKVWAAANFKSVDAMTTRA